MLSKKSVVLSGKDNSKQKAVLSMECDGMMLRGKVRLYNFASEPRGIISLGIYHHEKVIKAGLTKVSTMLFSFQTQIEKIPDKFSCAVVNFVGGEPAPILYGTSDGNTSEDIFAEVISSLKEATSVQEVEDVLGQYGIDYDEEEQKEIEKAIDDEMAKNDEEACGRCEECKYKKYYMEHVTSLTSIAAAEEKLESEEKKIIEEKPSFYSEIKDQIEKLFNENKEEEYLEELIPNSKWVKVEVEDGGDYYVFGLLYEENKLRYVCYGVPGVYQKNPPRELSGYPVWFPLDEGRREGFGYWLTYQDADSGESIKAIVE